MVEALHLYFTGLNDAIMRHGRIIFIISLFSPFLSIANKPVSKDKAKELAAKHTLAFIENKGQVQDQDGNTRTDIQYKISAGSNLNIFIGGGSLHYQWNKIQAAEKVKMPNLPGLDSSNEFQKPGNTEVADMYRMDVELLNANKNAKIIAEEEQTYTERYFMDLPGTLQEKNKGLFTHSFSKITYKNIYPSIDWVLYIKDNTLEYDFIVHPGAHVKDIQLKYGGATNLMLNAEGGIRATTPMGVIDEGAPHSYEKESKLSVRSSFVLKDNILSFNTGNYKGTLVIDPSLAWATYFGGSGADLSYGISCDPIGNVYMFGYTFSVSHIATSGSYMSMASIGNYGFLAKFDSTGSLLWSTYYYGNNGSYWPGCNNVSCDPSGNVYICGELNSNPAGLATSGAHQTSNAGSFDAFLAKFDGTGSLLWATFFGGDSTDYGVGVSCDPSGNVYLTGVTFSPSGIASSGSYRSFLMGSRNQYLAKFNSNGTLLWSTYFGDSCSGGGDFYGNVACDPSGNVFICGTTCGSSNIATSSAFQSTYGGGAYDAYLAKFNSSGSIQWATYYGGALSDLSYGITCDQNGNVFMTGHTNSTNNIASTGAYQTSLSGASDDAFLVKFDGSGSRQWGTYFGGTGTDGGVGVVCNSSGNIFMSGYTASSSNIATSGAYQTTLGGGPYDAFLSHFDSSGSLVWASYYGGSGIDWGAKVACNPSDSIFTTGTTYSTSHIATPGAYQTSGGGGFYDCFLAKWASLFKIGGVDSIFCVGDTLHIPFLTDYSFANGNIFEAQLSDASGNFTNGPIIGADTATISGYIFCTIPAGTSAGTGYRFRVLSTSPIDSTKADTVNINIKALPVFTTTSNSPVCEGKLLSFSATSSFSGLSYHWSGPYFAASSANPSISPVALTDSGYYYVSDTLAGCFTNDTIHITVLPGPISPMASANTPCVGDTLKLNASSSGSGVSYKWTGPGFYTSLLQNPMIPYASTANSGTYHAIFTISNGCSDTLNVPALVNPVNGPPVIDIIALPGDTICTGDNITLTATVSNAGSPSYQWRKNGTNITGATSSSITTSSVSNGDIITCRVKSNSPCQPIDSAISNQVHLYVRLYPPPLITVTTFPANYYNGALVTFTGNVLSGIGNLSFQWRKNGLDIPSANTSTLTTSNLTMGDTICLFVHSNVPCTFPDSEIICVELTNGIPGLQSSAGKIKVYPSPFNDQLIIESSVEGSLFIFDILGQEVYRGESDGVIKVIDTRNLCKGNYILEIIDDTGNRTVTKIIK